MRTIKVTKVELNEIRHDIHEGGEEWGLPFETACKCGFPGFAGGLDHIDQSDFSLTIVDRGVSRGGNRVIDNTTKFVVPMKER